MADDFDEKPYVDRLEGYVCPACVTDAFLKQALQDALEDENCDYCDAAQAAPTSVLLELLGDALTFWFTDPAEVSPYDGREGGYLWPQRGGDEIVTEEFDDWTSDDSLRDGASECFAGTDWCERNFGMLSEYEALSHGWHEFTRQVKHVTRFLFFTSPGPDELYVEEIDGLLPGRVLEQLGKLFRSYGMFRVLPPGQRLVRARVVRRGERPSTPAELGTPPHDRAVNPNRMSPAGIGMFYAGFDRATAILETYEPRRSRNREIAVAEFECLRPLHVLDLTHLPHVPSRYDAANRSHRDPIRFLRAFERDFTQPVERDGRAHAEYAPTQAITEYARHRLTTPEGHRVDGIVYSSSRDPGSEAIVVFAGPEHCGPLPDQDPGRPEPFLSLVGIEYLQPPFRRYTERPSGGRGRAVPERNPHEKVCQW